MSYFRVTLLRSAIGLPRRTTDVLKALGLKKRMATVFHPVSPSVAGQIMKVKELVEVQEVDRRLTKEEVRAERRPDPGYYIEKASIEEFSENRSFSFFCARILVFQAHVDAFETVVFNVFDAIILAWKFQGLVY
ncbi:hypothetical protein KXX16_008084 [Aspergillus fumigatus]|uniref:Large ribosomal subunit protein uL30m n=1 Tax=Aspergillus fumigatus TaxID=746128 RepID=A0A9P8SVW1_ASPFM|nr:hypothetical protein KXX45_005312 [Aspergillus fumigatus]KAH1307266.1 hypothetical protein KXX11_003668 [Aspergillus fumigatus]KAH1317631.1 hypothetical protein KXX38_001547 [Aspergillus fumigatus]KAH1445907.1 hypothetical protein KXX68_006806 [Aspergillus fumigatus]KAH1563778.1 hypothetical protein KXX37_006413 [Aspergillus fumigatus]